MYNLAAKKRIVTDLYLLFSYLSSSSFAWLSRLHVTTRWATLPRPLLHAGPMSNTLTRTHQRPIRELATPAIPTLVLSAPRPTTRPLLNAIAALGQEDMPPTLSDPLHRAMAQVATATAHRLLVACHTAPLITHLTVSKSWNHSANSCFLLRTVKCE